MSVCHPARVKMQRFGFGKSPSPPPPGGRTLSFFKHIKAGRKVELFTAAQLAGYKVTKENNIILG